MPGTFTPELTFGPYQSGMWQETGGLSYRTMLLNSVALSLDFITSTVLDSRVVATGGANGTVTNSSGVLVTASAPRYDYSPTAIGTIRGLLVEEARTNLFLNSNLAGTNLATQNVAVTAQAYTISFYGTGSITLTGAAAAVVNGSGAYPTRVTSTFTPAAGTLTCTVAGTVQYAQIEVGGFASSFIPTAGATVTRTSDSLSMTGVDFTSWYNAVAGTFLVEFIPGLAATGTFRTLGNVNSATAAGVFINTVGSYRTGLAGAADAGTGNAVNYGVVNKSASAFEASTQAISCLNGGTVATGTYDWSSATNGLYLGLRGAGTAGLFGWLRTVAFYGSRLPDSQLQSLTT